MAAIPALMLIVALIASGYAAARWGQLVFQLVFRHREQKRVAGLALPSQQQAEPKDRLMRHVYKFAGRFPWLKRLLDHFEQKRREEAMREALPEMVRLLGIMLGSGASLIQAFEYSAANCPEPLAGELRGAVYGLKAGRAFDDVMQELRERVGGAEFSYLAAAMEIQHKSGGALKDVLASVAGTLQEQSRLHTLLHTKTAQGRLSMRIVSLMPLVLLAVVSLFSPAYVMEFFQSAFGVFLFVFALLLDVLGVFAVRKTLTVDLSASSSRGQAWAGFFRY